MPKFIANIGTTKVVKSELQQLCDALKVMLAMRQGDKEDYGVMQDAIKLKGLWARRYHRNRALASYGMSLAEYETIR